MTSAATAPVKVRETFSVVYRSGGTHRCRWSRILDVFPTRETAQGKAAQIEQSGRKALIFKTGELNRIGLPIGWEPSFVNWDEDEIRFVNTEDGIPLETIHEKEYRG